MIGESCPEPERRQYAFVDAMPGPADRRVRSCDGVRLHTEVFGPEDGYPIVLAHGITCAIRVWAHQIADLSRDYRVIAFDHRGHGRSDVPPRRGNYSLDFLAADLDAVLDATLRPGERAVIAGHSMGGMAIASWAARYPRRVRRCADAVALINTSTGDVVRDVRMLQVPTRWRRQGSAPRARCSRPSARHGDPGRGTLQPSLRLDDGGRARRRSRDRRLRLRPVRGDAAGRARRVGQGARRLDGRRGTSGCRI